MNISQIKHQKVFPIAIYHSTDLVGGNQGSGIKSITIYGQAVSGPAIAADFALADYIGMIEDVDTMPSASVLGSSGTPYYNTQVLLRNISGKPVKYDADKTPKHNSSNVYKFNFDNYVNGMYYHVWLLAIDKAGNLESLDDVTTAIDHTTPTFTTTQALVDDISPEFDGVETINNVTYDSVGYSGNTSLKYYVNSGDIGNITGQAAIDYFENKVISYSESGEKKTRYVGVGSLYDSVNNRLYLDIDYTSTSGNPSGNTVKLLPNVTATGSIGSIEVKFPLSNSLNLLKYKIERVVDKADINGNLVTNNIIKDNTVTSPIGWFDPVYVDKNDYVDRGLTFPANSFTINPSCKKLLYKITPVSRWTDANNSYAEILGESIYTTIINFNAINFRPSVGTAPTDPTNVVQTTNNNGTITLSWNAVTDVDLSGYTVQRQTRVGLGGNQTVGEWVDVAIVDKNDTTSFTDVGLVPYNPTKTDYSYRVRAFDYAGNISGWVPNTATYSEAYSSAAPNVSVLTTKTVTGKVGGWQCDLAVTNPGGLPKIKSIKVFGKKGSTRTIVQGMTSSYIGEYFVDLVDETASFSWMTALSNVIEYAQFQFILVDEFNNESTKTTAYPSNGSASETPQTIVDNIAPSVAGYTVTPVVIPNAFDSNSIEVTLNTGASLSVFKIKVKTDATGTLQQGIKANELAGKTLLDVNTGESKVIASNLASNVSTPYNVQVTLSGNLTTAPSVGDIIQISPEHVRVTIDQTNELLTATASVVGSNADFTELIDTTKSWITNQWQGWDAHSNGEVRQVASNTGTVLTLDSPFTQDPSNIAYSITKPSDLVGFNLFRGKVVGAVTSSWTSVPGTIGASSNDIFDVTDDAATIGVYKYGISAHDASNHESSIKESVNSVTITDDAAPAVPHVQGVIGGAGSLLVYWNRTAADIDHYELTIQNSGGTDLLSVPTTILGENYTYYGITDTKTQIEAYQYKVIAYDSSGNALTSDPVETLNPLTVFLDDYVPATGTAPNAITNPNDIAIPANSGILIVPDNDGNATVTIVKEHVDVETRILVVQRQTKNFNSGIWSGLETITSIQTPRLTVDNIFVDDMVFIDSVNSNVTVKYSIVCVGSGGLSSAAAVSAEQDVVDFTGYDLATKVSELTPIVTADVGRVFIKFKDIIDKNSATYEIWRTSDTSTTWNTNFYTDTTIQPKPIHSNWEKIATLPSTLANNTQTDYIQYSDLDWQANGTIDSKDTTLSIPYDAKAVYAVVGVDRWGNRGTLFFLPNGTNDTNSIIYVPHEPRVNRIEKDALYWNFNKSVQANRGDVPINDPDAILHKGYGIEVLGDLRFNIDKLGGDYSLVVRRLQKSFDAMGLALTSITDVLIYDTSKEDNAWIFNKLFPEVALIISSLNHLFVYDYNGKLSSFDFIVGATNMLPFEVGSVSAIDGKIICTGTGIVILDFKNDSGRWIQATTDKVYGGTISTRNNGLSYA